MEALSGVFFPSRRWWMLQFHGKASVGAVSGLIFAIVFRKQGPQKPEVVWEEEEDETNVPI
jgi:hypothetical protein